MPRLADTDLRSPRFKTVIQEADVYAETTGLDKWATRVFWITLKYSPLAARQYASKQNRASPAWARYSRLVEVGLIIENPEGVAWLEGVEPWTSDSLLWFDTITRIAAGAIPPQDLHRLV